jgi:hypothetical protein
MTISWIQRKPSAGLFGRKMSLPSRSYIVLVLSTLIILLGGGVTLLWQIHQGTSSRADGGDVVGPPTLPAATVDQIFAEVGSPMVGTGKIVEQAARRANIDDAFALAVWWVETNDGQAGVGLNNRNPGAVASTNGFIFYPSYADAVTDWFSVLRSRYIDRGLTSVYTICYPYVATSHSLEWANKVVNYMLRYRGEAPAPTPVPTLGHAPVYPQFMPSHETTMGEDRKAESKLPAPPTTVAQPATGIPALTTLPTFSAQNSLPWAICALLVVLALLLVRLNSSRQRKAVQVVEAVTEALQPVSSLPPLYVNEYSPIAEPASSPSSFWQEQLAQFQNAQRVQAQAQSAGGPISSAEGLFAASVANSASISDGFLRTPGAKPVLLVDGIPQLSFYEPLSVAQTSQAAIGSGGMPGSLRARRLVQMPTQERYPTTEMLPPLSRPGLSLPGRLPEPVAVGAPASMPEPVVVGAGTRPSGGGLLRRYGMEQAGRQ